jgi:NAD+ synthase (glutamine-hydrolysing)
VTDGGSDPLRIALAQLDFVVGDLDGNAQRILSTWERAAASDCALVAFPRLALTGYPAGGLLDEPDFATTAQRTIGDLAEAGPRPTVAVVGCPVPDSREVASGISDGAALLRDGEVIDARAHPVHDIDGSTVGVTVGPPDDLAPAVAGLDLVVVVGGDPFTMGRPAWRDAALAKISRSADAPVAFVNHVGGQDHLVFDGGTLVHAPDGVVVRARPFEEDHLVVDLPPAPTSRPVPEAIGGAEALWTALALATRDYCRKNGFPRVVIGLSGGIDSSVTAAIAADALGAPSVLGVAMPSPYNPPGSLEDAQRLAGNLGFEFEVHAIAPALRSFDAILQPALAGLEPDETEENLQARIRATILMALANKFDRLVLATGNKSEFAIGYATLYGDMAGGFAPLKDVTKRRVYELARWRNRDAVVIPTAVLSKPPSAELRPDQRDEDAVAPYDVIDAVVESYLAGRPLDEIVADGYDEATVYRLVDMVRTAEFKRRQGPLGPKVTGTALGVDVELPVTQRWRRRPPPR